MPKENPELEEFIRELAESFWWPDRQKLGISEAEALERLLAEIYEEMGRCADRMSRGQVPPRSLDRWLVEVIKVYYERAKHRLGCWGEEWWKHPENFAKIQHWRSRIFQEVLLPLTEKLMASQNCGGEIRFPPQTKAIIMEKILELWGGTSPDSANKPLFALLAIMVTPALDDDWYHLAFGRSLTKEEIGSLRGTHWWGAHALDDTQNQIRAAFNQWYKEPSAENVQTLLAWLRFIFVRPHQNSHLSLLAKLLHHAKINVSDPATLATIE